MRGCSLSIAILTVLFLVSCGDSPKPGASVIPAPAEPTQQVFQVKGTIVELQPEEKSVRIKHEEIPGYMQAMTMPFDVRDTNELAGLEAGDIVTFRMTVTETDGWIDQLKRLNASRTNSLPSIGSFRFTRDVDPLEIGDPLPEYHFTNQFGAHISTTQFKGQALAITFIFTRCPYPTFCPKMSSLFAETQKKLLANSGGPTNWHLLTLSFDPEYDTPAVLKNYAAAQGADPRHWTFATGTLIDVTAITEQFGLQFWREAPGESISHNLRTAVVDARGRVQAVLRENKWSSDDLMAEILKATNP